MKKISSLSIFLPAYNEAANIEASVREAKKVAEKLSNQYEVIVVNDGSKDETGEIADRLAAEDPEHLRVIHHQPNQGYGAALWSGFQAARFEYVFFTDADLQFELAELERLVDQVPSHSAVLGVRTPRRDPWLRLVNAKGWNLLNRWLFGLRVSDIDCAFKLFDRQLIVSLPLRSRGAMMSAEMLIRLQRSGIKFKEVPVTHKPRLAGEATGAKPAVILRAFREMLTVYESELGRPTVVQIVKFGLVGVVNTLVDLIGYFILTRSLPLAATYAVTTKGLTFFLGTISSFTLNRLWTFRLTSQIRVAEVVKFYVSVLTSLVLNVGATFIFLRLLGLYDLWAVILATLITFAWNFVLSRFWVFVPATAGTSAKTQPPQPAW